MTWSDQLRLMKMIVFFRRTLKYLKQNLPSANQNTHTQKEIDYFLLIATKISILIMLLKFFLITKIDE